MAKVMLIQPHVNIKQKNKKVRLDAPSSLIFIGTAIEDKHQVKIYDRNLDYNDDNFLNFLNRYKPDIVGMTSQTGTMLFDLMHLGKLIKKVSPRTTIIVGGIHATTCPESLLKEPYVDFVIRGEGEEAFLEFCDTFDKNPKKLEKLKNINYNPKRPFANMEDLKLPNYKLVDTKKYEHFYISLSRGCPGNCTFCYNVEMWGNNGRPLIRMYSTEKAIELFKKLIENNIKVFSMADDNFLTFKSRCLKICKFLEGKGFKWMCLARVDYINDKIAQALKKAGCHTLQIGVESGCQRVLDFLNKKTTVKQNMEAIKCLERNGIVCDASMMIGITTETKEELDKTKEFVKKYKPTCPDAQIFNPMPGTDLFDVCIKEGKIKKPKTLEGWAKWGDVTSITEIPHNTSKIPDDYIMKTAKEIMRHRFYLNKLKKAICWIKMGEFRVLWQTFENFLKEIKLKRRYG